MIQWNMLPVYSIFNDDFNSFNANNHFHFKSNGNVKKIMVKIWMDDGITEDLMNYQYLAKFNNFNSIDFVEVHKETHLRRSNRNPNEIYFQHGSQTYQSREYGANNYMRFYEGGTKYSYDSLNRLISVSNEESFDKIVYQHNNTTICYSENTIKHEFEQNFWVSNFKDGKVDQILVYDKKTNSISESFQYFYDSLDRVTKIEQFSGNNYNELESDEEEMIIYDSPKIESITYVHYENIENGKLKVLFKMQNLKSNEFIINKSLILDSENKILKVDHLNDDDIPYYIFSYNYDYDGNGNWVRLEITLKYKSEEKKNRVIERIIEY